MCSVGLKKESSPLTPPTSLTLALMSMTPGEWVGWECFALLAVPVQRLVQHCPCQQPCPSPVGPFHVALMKLALERSDWVHGDGSFFLKKMLSQVVSLAGFVCVCVSLVLELPFLFRVEGHSACVCVSMCEYV